MNGQDRAREFILKLYALCREHGATMADGTHACCGATIGEVDVEFRIFAEGDRSEATIYGATTEVLKNLGT